ncbi:MAG: putative secreted protein, partial [Armatimonadetes bacterium]|nr:putative secreted protein [Armatimonadota bacterium]
CASARLVSRPTAHAVFERLASQPLTFEANEGQTDGRVRYLSRGSGYGLFLASDEAVLQLAPKSEGVKAPAVVRMRLDGANRRATVRGTDPVATRSHYFLGRDPARWRTGVGQFARVRYEQVYEGIDLVYYGNQRQLEYDFVVAPGADPAAIRLRFDGAERATLAENGDLLLDTPAGTLRQHRPVVYQETAGRREQLEGAYRLADAGTGTTVTFEVGAYDRTRPLVIDPVLSYVAAVGGPGDDYGAGIAVDAGGTAWVAGYTSSTTFPAAGATHRASGGGTEVFVARISSAGALLSVTFLGGSGDDRGARICLDSSGNAYITGNTNSPNFPTVAPLQGAFGGLFDAFVAKLNASGSTLLYSTYLGGTGDDRSNDICVDGSGQAYVAGLTTSAAFPTTAGAYSRTLHSQSADAFVSVLGAAGNGFLYSTYLGGSGDDLISGIVPDGNGGAYLAGDTTSVDFPLSANAFQRVPGGGLYDAFVAHLDPGGAALDWSTLVGGNGVDRPTGLAVGFQGACYVTGFTNSTSFPVVNAPQPAAGGGAGDAFVTVVNGSGTGVIYSTYLGGTGRDTGQGIVVGPDGTASVVGLTDSNDLPGAGGGALAGTDAFVARIPAGGLTFAYASYLGGGGGDLGLGIAADLQGDLYITGGSSSQDFMTGPFRGGQVDAFAVRLAMEQLTAPSNLTASVVSSCQINLAWQDHSDNEDSFTIERRTGAGPFGPVGAAGANQTTYSDIDLAPLTSYTYRVRAASATGSSQPSNTASGTTPVGPTPPSSLQAVAVSTSRINLTWADNSADETGFIVERSTNGGLSFTQRASLAPNVTSWPDTGLAAGTTYTYQVRAAVTGGCSAASNQVSATTQPGAPAPPTSLFAFAHTGGGVDLVWDDGSFNETTFKIERATGAGAFAQIDTTPANAEAYLDLSAAPSTQYRYRVRASNSGGDSAFSNIATVTTPAGAPLAPTALAVSVFSSSELRLTWSDSSTNEANFKIDRRVAPGSFAEVAQVDSNVTSFADTGLTPNTTYIYRVRATNALGSSAPSNEASGTTPIAPPAAPTGLAVAPLSRTQLRLTWTHAAGGAASFRVERKTGAAAFAFAGTVSGDQREYTDSGLAAGTSYVYRIYARNSGGDSPYSNEVTGTTLPDAPLAPTDALATPLSRTSVQVTWADRSSDEDTFRIERRTAGGSFELAGTAMANSTSFTDPGRTGETEYTYRIAAVNGGGTSGFSNLTSATTFVNPPTGLTVTATAMGTLRVAWVDASAIETFYLVERAANGSGFTEIGSVGPNQTSYLDTGLPSDMTFSYRVRSTDGRVPSEYAGPVDGTTLPVPPSAPQFLSVSVLPGRSLQLDWIDTSNNESGFVVERRDPGGSFAPVTTVPAGTHTFVDSGLTGATAYTYRVKAVNAGGESGYSNEASGTTLPDPPAVPLNLTVTVDPTGGLRLAWADASSNETSFEIERATGAGAFAPLVSAPANATGYLDGTVQGLTSYTYRVSARNGGGDSAPSNTATATAPNPIPPAPSGLSAVVFSATRVRLTWTDNSGGQAQFRILRRSAGAAQATAVGTAGAGSTTYTDGGLSAATEYTYSVTAFTSGGESVASNEVIVSIPTGGVLSLSSRVNFGSRKVATRYVKSITLKNKGRGLLSGFVDPGSVTGAFRVLEGGGSFSLARNQKKILRVEFAPTAKATFNSSLRVTSSDPRRDTVDVAVYGKGK